MYCSDSYDEAYGLYASEHPFDANLDFEYDSKSFYDEVDPNLYEPTCGLVGRSSSEAWRAGRVAPPLVVLTSIKMEKETGCSTMKEHAARWEHKMKEKEQQQRREKEKERKIKEKKDAEDEAKWEAIKASLPTESRLGKQKRLAKERNERQLKSKLRWLARKKKTVAKPLPFGHRRNGGGKRRGKTIKGFGKEAEREKEVIRLRRATKKKARKLQKKLDEEKRQEEFKMAPPKVVELVTQDYIVNDQDDDEREAEQEQMQLVRDHVVKNFQDFEQYLTKTEAKTTEAKTTEAKVKETAKEAPWTRVGKKKEKIVVIKLVTPKMIEEEKIEEGVAKLVDTKSMRTTLVRSKMCRSVGTGKPCPHGSKCRYAHSPSELKVPPCFFEDACRHVRKCGGRYKNCCKRKCFFMHPGEDMSQYCQRLGLGGPARLPKCLPDGPRLLDGTPMSSGSFSIPKQKLSPPPPENPWTKVWSKPAEVVKTEVVKTEVVKTESEWTTVKSRQPKKRRQKKKPKKKPKKEQKPKERPMCRSVGTGRPCRHGASCRFRHK